MEDSNIALCLNQLRRRRICFSSTAYLGGLYDTINAVSLCSTNCLVLWWTWNVFSVRHEQNFCVRTSPLKGLCTWNYVFTSLSQWSDSLRRLGLVFLMSECWGRRFHFHLGVRMCSSFFSVPAVWRSKSSCDPRMKGLAVSKFNSKLD